MDPLPFTRPISAPQYVAEFGPMLKQLGATHVELPGTSEIKLTYTNINDAVMARAAFDDVVSGAKLVIDDTSAPGVRPLPTLAGVASLIDRVPGVDTRIAQVGFVPTLMIASKDKELLDGLRRVMRESVSASDGTVRTEFFSPDVMPD